MRNLREHVQQHLYSRLWQTVRQDTSGITDSVTWGVDHVVTLAIEDLPDAVSQASNVVAKGLKATRAIARRYTYRGKEKPANEDR